MAADIQDFDIGLLDDFPDAHSSYSPATAHDQVSPIYYECCSDNSQVNEQLSFNDGEDAEAAEAAEAAEMDQDNAKVIKDQDRFPPVANVMKIMKLILPSEMKVSIVSVFVNLTRGLRWLEINSITIDWIVGIEWKFVGW